MGSGAMRNTGVMALSVGFGARAVMQAALFVALARMLGPAEFGSFTAVLSIMSIVSCLAGSGAGLLLVRDSVGTDSRAGLVGRALKLVLATAVPLIAAAAGLALLLLPGSTPWAPVVAVAVAEILLVPLTDIAMRLYQGLGLFSQMALVSAAPQLTRLLLLAVAWDGSLDAAGWSLLYLLATALSCALVWGRAMHALGAPRWDLAGAREIARGGFPLAASNLAMRATVDADKSLIARWVGTADTGHYAAAHRFVDLALIPVVAAVEATLPRLFEAARRGRAEVLSLGLRAARLPMLFSFVAAAGLYFGAPLLPWLLGADYAAAVPALQAFALLPPLASARLLARNALYGAGAISLAGGIELTGAVIAVGLGVLLIPPFGWPGALAAKIAGEALLLVATLAVLRRELRAPA
jgi:O-antigen/teichoic acid export membrane protein